MKNEYQLNYMRVDKLLEVLISYAPDGSENEHINKMVQSNAQPKDYILALHDGLKYGNWPWVNHNQCLLNLNQLSEQKLPSQKEFIKRWTNVEGEIE